MEVRCLYWKMGLGVSGGAGVVPRVLFGLGVGWGNSAAHSVLFGLGLGVGSGAGSAHRDEAE